QRNKRKGNADALPGTNLVARISTNLAPNRRQSDLHTKIEANLRQLLRPQMQPAVSKLEIDLRGLWPQTQDLLENQLSPDLQKEARQSVPDFAGHRRELSESIQAAYIDILAGKTVQEQLARSYSQTA